MIIGYLQLAPGLEEASDAAARMKAMGAQVVRVEEDPADGGLAKPMLRAICTFLGKGDELMVPDLRHISGRAGAVLAVVRGLHERGAHLRVLEPELSSAEDRGRDLFRLLEALEPDAPPPAPAPVQGPRRRVDPEEIRALHAFGFGPSQIAAKLGVSRMTVWRTLAKSEVGEAVA
jgi:DNA invertase Pin-like site-specific DNA recombinase